MGVLVRVALVEPSVLSIPFSAVLLRTAVLIGRTETCVFDTAEVEERWSHPDMAFGSDWAFGSEETDDSDELTSE